MINGYDFQVTLYDPFTNLTFKYDGGAYVDVYHGHHTRTPHDTINVWDHARGERVGDGEMMNRVRQYVRRVWDDAIVAR